MKLFVLLGGWDYEGFDHPVGVFSTKELAEAQKERTRHHTNYDNWQIAEYELDEREMTL